MGLPVLVVARVFLPERGPRQQADGSVKPSNDLDARDSPNGSSRVFAKQMLGRPRNAQQLELCYLCVKTVTKPQGDNTKENT